MPKNLIPILYGIAIAYAAITCLVRENGIIMIEVIGFGLPLLLWLLFEWVAPPIIAALIGFQARQSIAKALAGIPLVFLYASVTPTVHGKSVVIPSIIPWLAAFPSSLTQAMPIIQERLILWGGVFLVALIFGKISRQTHPSSGTLR